MWLAAYVHIIFVPWNGSTQAIKFKSGQKHPSKPLQFYNTKGTHFFIAIILFIAHLLLTLTLAHIPDIAPSDIKMHCLSN